MSCENKELARKGPFQIHRCGECDGFSLHLGPVTLRLDERAVRSLTEMLQDGLRALDRHRYDGAKASLTTGVLFAARIGTEPSS